MPQALSLGLDVGSVNAKLVLVDAAGTPLRKDTERITANPRGAVSALLARLAAQVPLEEIGSAGASGAGKSLIPPDFGWAEYSSSLALAAGVLDACPQARTLIQVGGQSSLVVRLEDGLRRPWQVATNPLCAAGTGRFLEQQANRLGIRLDEFADLALACQGRPPRIAARCSVFAKSDLIHLQQKGVAIDAMLYALCESIARMVASLTRGPFEEPICLAGGLAANAAFVKALEEVITARNKQPAHLLVVADYLHVEALGAALLARGRTARVAMLPEGTAKRSYMAMARLTRETPPSPNPSGREGGNGRMGERETPPSPNPSPAAAGEGREGSLTMGVPPLPLRERAGGEGVPAGREGVCVPPSPNPSGREWESGRMGERETPPSPNPSPAAAGEGRNPSLTKGVPPLPLSPSPIPPLSAAPLRGYLGVDVGSTSTKAAIVDESGTRVLAKHYLMTAGRPIEAVKELFRALLAAGAGEIEICGVGVTGSGRYLVGSFIGADLVKNEITAQTRAAAEIDPDADIIEIGGQDSKLVLKRNGVVVDYQMNKACAAGTGSFIDELAELLGVSVKNGEFARLAFAAPYTIDLGTRCAAFMAQAVAAAQQEGEPLEVITASLALAIARNYLSKVVGTRKLGQTVILTGAVFYNEAVAAAFRDELPDKKLIVAEHKEVSGAIGAAQLAREAVLSEVGRSRFKGFAAVAKSEPKLTTFTCQHCANSCAITRMQAPGEPATYYGSRCDRYDQESGARARGNAALPATATAANGAAASGRPATLFDEREGLLFREYQPDAGSGPRVAVPRALLVYDFAPLLLGFLNSLGARVTLSGRTDKQIMEQAVELSYTDSCFPLKLLHGHTAVLRDADFILYPSLLRLGPKDGPENQRYACPLVQASPFIVRAALDLDGRRLLAPAIDLSRGPEPVLRSLADAAVAMGYSRREGLRAARAGLASQDRFAADLAAQGARRLAELRASGRLGVALFARAYMSQDGGANLGIAEKLAQLGVVPVPLDFLPLPSVEPKQYSDRPYWQYESKQIAAAALTAEDPSLYGLVLTNFGCGPNSFILRLVEDIMGAKPLGQLEIDEHAAEAGIVTRLEAFVDTIEGHARTSRRPDAAKAATAHREIYRGTTATIGSGKTLLLPRMAPHAHVLAAAFEACGVRARVLPEADERNLLYANPVTSGTECLPYRVSLGDFIRAHHELNGDLRNAEGFMAGSFGPCRLGKYAIEQMRILKDMGIGMTIRSSVSNNAYRDLNMGPGFERLAWRGIVAMDCLQKLQWRTRPYEREAGAVDALFEEYTERIAAHIRSKGPLDDVLQQATAAFRAAVDPVLPRRPCVGINGEIYLRANRFSNSDLVRVCEAAGLEVVVSPLGEWFKYTAFRNVEDAAHDRRPGKAMIAYVKQLVQERDERMIGALCGDLAGEREPSTSELLARSSRWLSPLCGSEAVLSLGSGVEWLESPHFAGVISVMPHGCMPGGIVAAVSERLSARYGKPWINLTYDGFVETNNLARINNFAEVIRFSRA